MLSIIFAIILIFLVFVIVSPKPQRLSPKRCHVMITGGSSGIGLAIAKECAQLGAFISIIARNEDKLKDAKIEIDEVAEAGDDKVICVPLDVAKDPNEVKTEIKKAVEILGPVDFLFNCAGTSHSQKFEDTSLDVFMHLMKVNYFGSVYCTHAVLVEMKKRKQGRIIFISSQAGQLGLYGYSAYSGTKFALRGLAEAIQMEVKPHNIAVTMSFPPDTDTPGFHTENQFGQKPEETILISETGGLYSAENVAKKIVSDSVKGIFMSNIGLEGFLLGNVTAGMSPCNAPMSAFFQGIFLGLLRIIGLGYIRSFDKIVQKCARKREEDVTMDCNDL